LASLRIIGPGRAGESFARALGQAGWAVQEPLRRGDPLRDAAADVDLLLIATPDRTVAEVAAAVTPSPDTVVAHVAGSLGLDVLVPHVRRASIHPLLALADPAIGAERLRGAWFAVAGDPLAWHVVESLGGRGIEVPDDKRAAYHAAACVASNHFVALLAHVERIAAEAGLPLEAYLDLVRGTVDNVEQLGTTGALTGPVARGDWETVARHRQAIPEADRAAYDALVQLTARLAGREVEAALT
jgi:predicted short-subunit dehydrogenase-like oxidoreductase (DUF2520 family)